MRSDVIFLLKVLPFLPTKDCSVDQDLLTVSDVAVLLRCSENTTRRFIDRGKIKAERLTQKSPRRIYKQHLDQYAQQQGIELDWSRLTFRGE